LSVIATPKRISYTYTHHIQIEEFNAQTILIVIGDLVAKVFVTTVNVLYDVYKTR